MLDYIVSRIDFTQAVKTFIVLAAQNGDPVRFNFEEIHFI